MVPPSIMGVGDVIVKLKGITCLIVSSLKGPSLIFQLSN